MKRNIILSVALLIVSSVVMAVPITGRQAAKKAHEFLYGNSKMKFAAGAVKMATSDEGIQPYYVFNIGNNGGFVIVSGDDAAYPVLGYSRSGSFDADSIPENMRMWLKGYAADIKKIQKMNLPAYNADEKKAEVWPTIPKLVSSEWNQTHPYNLQCPKYSGDYNNRPTGCVATAMAQVMYYHKWPVDATEEIPAYSFNDEALWGGDGSVRFEEALEPTVFNWKSMTDKYDYYSDKKSETAVAELMKYVGHSVKMMYGVQASGAFSEDIAGALINYFGYKSTARIVYRDNYSTQEEWDALMYNELVENRPILYSGVTKDEAGHQFVCDGYENGFFHINWGWGGMSDGFFKLEILDPYDQGTGGAGTGMAFSEMQSAVIGVQKPVENDALFVDNVKSNVGDEVRFDVVLKNFRKNYTSMQFDLKLPDRIEIPSDGVGTPKVTFVKTRSEKGDHKVELNKLSDGSYRFVVYSPTNSFIKGNEGALIKVAIKIPADIDAGDYPAQISNVLMCNQDMKGFDINGCDFSIEVKGEKLLLGDADDNGDIDENDITHIVNNILYIDSTPINFKLADVDADGMLDIEDVMLTSDIILKNAGAERNIITTQQDLNDVMAFTPYDNDLLLTLNNNTIYKAMQFDVTLSSDVSFTDNVSLTERTVGFECMCKEIAKGKYRVVLFTRNALNIEGNEGAVIRLTTDKIAEKAKITNIVMVTSDLRKMLLKDFTYKLPTGIDDITAETNGETEIYTLQGIRVNSDVERLAKGIYIINGKKVVIR